MDARKFLLGAISDPNSHDLSSTRVAGLVAAVGGVVFAFVHPSEATTVTAMLAGSAAFFFSRTTSSPGS